MASKSRSRRKLVNPVNAANGYGIHIGCRTPEQSSRIRKRLQALRRHTGARSGADYLDTLLRETIATTNLSKS